MILDFENYQTIKNSVLSILQVSDFEFEKILNDIKLDYESGIMLEKQFYDT